jgi:CubicO group peptidase (beta-lactamase class C family)
VSKGTLSIDAPLSKLLPESRDTDKAALTLKMLLNHAAGFPLYIPYFKELIGRFGDFRNLPFTDLRRDIIRMILAEKLVAAPGAVQQYSDLDFILLGEALGRLTGQDIAHYFQTAIAAPLGLSACFRRLPNEPVYGSQFAATELCPWRGEVLQGAVHDDHAYLMGGVAGHAGLFATAWDVHRLGREWMHAYQGKPSLFSPDTVRTFWTRTSAAEDATWTLGWDTPSIGQSTSGKYFSRNSVGHLGFTGASYWLDLDRDLSISLLTNRIHPLRSNLGIKKFRPEFHDLVMEGLLGIIPATS